MVNYSNRNRFKVSGDFLSKVLRQVDRCAQRTVPVLVGNDYVDSGGQQMDVGAKC